MLQLIILILQHLLNDHWFFVTPLLNLLFQFARNISEPLLNFEINPYQLLLNIKDFLLKGSDLLLTLTVNILSWFTFSEPCEVGKSDGWRGWLKGRGGWRRLRFYCVVVNFGLKLNHLILLLFDGVVLKIDRLFKLPVMIFNPFKLITPFYNIWWLSLFIMA